MKKSCSVFGGFKRTVNAEFEDFVPYKQSVGMKSLGFNKPCIAVRCDGSLFSLVGDNLIKTRFYGFYTIKNSECLWEKSEGGIQEVASPTFSQAFDFFRKKYGLNSFIQEEVKGKYRFCIEKWEDKKYVGLVYPSYKVAQIKCLNKLIETAKVKKIISNIEKNKV